MVLKLHAVKDRSQMKHQCNHWSRYGVALVLKVRARQKDYCTYLFYSQCTCCCLVVTVSILEWDSLKHSSHCSRYTSSCYNFESLTWVKGLLVEAGLLPGLPFTSRSKDNLMELDWPCLDQRPTYSIYFLEGILYRHPLPNQRDFSS